MYPSQHKYKLFYLQSESDHYRLFSHFWVFLVSHNRKGLPLINIIIKKAPMDMFIQTYHGKETLINFHPSSVYFIPVSPNNTQQHPTCSINFNSVSLMKQRALWYRKIVCLLLNTIPGWEGILSSPWISHSSCFLSQPHSDSEFLQKSSNKNISWKRERQVFINKLS